MAEPQGRHGQLRGFASETRSGWLVWASHSASSFLSGKWAQLL